jgi:hypothetical protein
MSRFIFFLLIVFSTQLAAQFKSSLVQIDTNKFQLVVKSLSPNGDTLFLSKRLPYPVFKIRQADVDNDSKDEIILGVYKATHLDTLSRNRINIYSVDSNKIKPKWLGSFLPHPLYDFDLVKRENKSYVITIEYEQNNLFLLAEYEWHSFGLKFVRYIKRNIYLSEALTLLSNPNEID